MKAIEDMILKYGKVLDGDVVVVSNFLNQKVNIKLLKEMAIDVKNHFNSKIDLVLTIEASGIPLATACALEYPCNMVFAKKSKTTNLDGDLYKSSVYSYTHQKTFDIFVKKEFLTEGENVLIVDDFLALGNAMNALIDICKQAKVNIIGLVSGIEKAYQNGGNELRNLGFDVYSLAKIEKIENGKVIFSK